jgi:hypothetical protein
MIRLLLTLIAFHLLLSSAGAQTLNPNWKQQLNTALQDFMACQGSSADKSDCLKYQGEALKLVYKVNDFYAEKNGRYMTSSEIAKFLKESNTWSALGPVYEQSTLKQAQDHANSKKAVVAVYQNAAGIGHVVVITPGSLQPSGSWGLNVPTVASFFTPEPERSFVDKGLSFAFTKNLMKDVTIYVRN